ncbi:MAG: 5'-nucleotidase C-terminal domain-containing protein, partial [Bacteroidia bacterium]|nr:5'-nucleotidase C-terminal domain-containing protein [Bacteroidia bacterium]
MRHKLILLLLACLVFLTCKKHPNYMTKIEAVNIDITDSLGSTASIDEFVKPYRDHINKDLDSVLAYSVDTYSKSDGELNTAIGNFMADLVYVQANPVFKSRTGKEIDFVLLNHGGIRSIISKGNVTTRTAFKVMPFENSIVVLDLQGQKVKELIEYLVRNKRAHPISKLNIELDTDLNLKTASLNERPLDFNKNYLVCTNDYLANGGDRMNFFKEPDSLYILDYKIRNALIDYLKNTDTIRPVRDNRFIQT